MRGIGGNSKDLLFSGTVSSRGGVGTEASYIELCGLGMLLSEESTCG